MREHRTTLQTLTNRDAARDRLPSAPNPER
jgi:hypothetical protein